MYRGAVIFTVSVQYLVLPPDILLLRQANLRNMSVEKIRGECTVLLHIQNLASKDFLVYYHLNMETMIDTKWLA